MSILTEMLPAYCEMLLETYSGGHAPVTKKYVINQIVNLANNAIVPKRAFVLEQISKLNGLDQDFINARIYWTK